MLAGVRMIRVDQPRVTKGLTDRNDKTVPRARASGRPLPCGRGTVCSNRLRLLRGGADRVADDVEGGVPTGRVVVVLPEDERRERVAVQLELVLRRVLVVVQG